MRQEVMLRVTCAQLADALHELQHGPARVANQWHRTPAKEVLHALLDVQENFRSASNQKRRVVDLWALSKCSAKATSTEGLTSGGNG